MLIFKGTVYYLIADLPMQTQTFGNYHGDAPQCYPLVRRTY
jgi:hypothetical protein